MIDKLERKKMNDMIDELIGFDSKKQIFDLWYEVTFLRFVLIQILESNPNLNTNIDIEKCRKDAQEVIINKFPLFKIDFSTINEPNSDYIHPEEKKN